MWVQRDDVNDETTESDAAELEVDDFELFFRHAEPRLRGALVATFGSELGRDAAAEALRYAWEHRGRVLSMDNPVGYLFRVGQRWGKRQASRERRKVGLVVVERQPDGFEPALDDALRSLPTRQRQVVVLCVGFRFSHAEAGKVLGISRSSIQKHVERAMTSLRRQIGADGD